MAFVLDVTKTAGTEGVSDTSITFGEWFTLQSADLVAELAQRGDAAAAALEGLQRHLASIRQVQLTPPAAAYSPH